MAFNGGAGKNGAVTQLNRLVLDRSKEPRRKLFDGAPGAAAVAGVAHIAGPGHRAGAGLVKEENRVAAALEQHRVPARKALLLRDSLRCGPAFAVEACQPDFHIGRPFAASTEPGGQETAGVRFDDRRCVTGWER